MTRANERTGVAVHLVGLLIAAAYVAALLGTSRDVGFARDEGFYFAAARSYQKWFDALAEDPARALEQGTVDRHWKHNHEHPALLKTLFGFSNRVFHEKLGWLSPATSFRLPGMLSGGGIVYLLFVFGARVFGPRAGLVAALSFALMPRVFYHAHLNCFDVPITAAWLLVTYLYWRSLSSVRYGALAGLAFGVALCVKLNAFFLPFVLGLHYVVLFVVRKVRHEKVPRPFAFAFGAVLAPAVFMAHWPWLWNDTWKRLLAYVGFHSKHAHYNTAWFGENIVQEPTPIALPLVMTLITIPTITLLLAGAGALLRARHHCPGFLERGLAPFMSKSGPADRDGLDLLIGLSVLVPIAIISLPSVPVFGGTKHWMPAFPFIALLAGAAIARLADVAVESLRFVPAQLVRAAVLLIALAPGLQQTAQSHPFGLASYVPLFGGAPGAASVGMTRQFWGYTTAGVLPWLNEHAPRGARVEFHDTAHQSVAMFREEKLLRRDIRIFGMKNADYALMQHELHMVRNESWIWNAFRTFSPVHVLTYQGVPIVSVYERPKKKRR